MLHNLPMCALCLDNDALRYDFRLSSFSVLDITDARCKMRAGGRT